MNNTLENMKEAVEHVKVLQDIVCSDSNIYTIDIGHCAVNGICVRADVFDTLFPDPDDYEVVTEGYTQHTCRQAVLNDVCIYALFPIEKEVQ